MHLLLFSGFLGSGKTTLVIKLAKFALEQGKKVAILVNEIGEVGIDNQLMRQLDMNVWELLNGCICCTLTADLVSTLTQLDSEYSPDVVIVEPSGAANPTKVLKALPYYKGTPLESLNTIAVIDPLRVEMLVEVMNILISASLKQADLVLVSKCDQASQEEIAYAHQISQEYKPNIKVVEVTKDSAVETWAKEIAPWMN